MLAVTRAPCVFCCVLVSRDLMPRRGWRSSVGRNLRARNGPVRVQDFLSQSIASNVESRAQVRSSQEGFYPPGSIQRPHEKPPSRRCKSWNKHSIDVRLPRTCRRPFEARVGEGSRSVTKNLPSMSKSSSAANSSPGRKRGWPSSMRSAKPSSML